MARYNIIELLNGEYDCECETHQGVIDSWRESTFDKAIERIKNAAKYLNWETIDEKEIEFKTQDGNSCGPCETDC